MTLTLELPYPPTLNHYIRHTQRGRYLTPKAKAFNAAVWAAVKQAKAPTFHPDARVRVLLELYPPDRRKHDIDNRCKPLLDAIEKSGVLPDDAQVDRITIVRPDPRSFTPVRPGRVRVTLATIEQEEEAAA